MMAVGEDIVFYFYLLKIKIILIILVLPQATISVNHLNSIVTTNSMTFKMIATSRMFMKIIATGSTSSMTILLMLMMLYVCRNAPLSVLPAHLRHVGGRVQHGCQLPPLPRRYRRPGRPAHLRLRPGSEPVSQVPGLRLHDAAGGAGGHHPPLRHLLHGDHGGDELLRDRDGELVPDGAAAAGRVPGGGPNRLLLRARQALPVSHQSLG